MVNASTWFGLTAGLLATIASFVYLLASRSEDFNETFAVLNGIGVGFLMLAVIPSKHPTFRSTLFGIATVFFVIMIGMAFFQFSVDRADNEGAKWTVVSFDAFAAVIALVFVVYLIGNAQKGAKPSFQNKEKASGKLPRPQRVWIEQQPVAE